jgi:hypothetical protein
MIRSVGWYAERLATPFQTPYPLALQGITENGHICLMMESTLLIGNDSLRETDFIAENILHRMPDDSLFRLPEGFDIIELSAKEILRRKKPAPLPVPFRKL